MKPITFACQATLPLPPEQIAAQILDLDQWPDFPGYGPLPGIHAAVFEAQTPEVVGARIRVTNRDGSSHTEEIVDWDPQRKVRLRMEDFSPPLSRLASHFDETWHFDRRGEETLVTREFALHPKSLLGRAVLRVIAWLLKRGVQRHLRRMQSAAGDQGAGPRPSPSN